MKRIMMMLACLAVWCGTAWAESEGMMKNEKKATFGGGCFWCMEQPFEDLDGVSSVLAGYTGGDMAEPTYREVSTGSTGHVEVVQVTYDPSKVEFETLLNIFWENIDPTQEDGQFADIGSQYRTVIYYHDEGQKAVAEKSKAALEASGKFDKPIATTIEPAKEFYAAEDYHQDYYKKNAAHYNSYKVGSGRAGYLKKTWGKEK